MSDPRIWGSIYWFDTHAIARSFLDQVLTTDQITCLTTFITLLSRMCPCPGCRFHALQHITSHPPNFATGQDVWAYTVSFHNAVNHKNHKTELTLQEAEDAFEAQLAQMNPHKIPLRDYFNFSYWVPLIYTSFLLSEKPNEEEVKLITQFFQVYAQVMPFAQHLHADGSRSGDYLVKVPIDVSTREKAIHTVLEMYNSVADEFHYRLMTLEDLKAEFNKLFHFESLKLLDHASKLIKETNEKLTTMQSQYEVSKDFNQVVELQNMVKQFEMKLKTPCAACVKNKNVGPDIAFIVVVVILILALLACLVMAFKLWRNRKQEQQRRQEQILSV